MKYNLERELRFVAEPKYKNLYPWAIQEIGEDGETARDQIPWTLSHSFLATELTMSERCATKSEYESGGSWIRAKLIPEGGRRFSRPCYSMFGTRRNIDLIQLFIHRREDESEDQENSARASGFPSYTSDDPLWGGTEPDMIQFDLHLSAAEFDRIAERIAGDQIDSARFDCRATGFYSEWTPDIEVDEYKVLCSDTKEQKIELPEKCEVKLPRLGEVWDATFSIQKIVQPRSILEQLRKDAAEEEADAFDDWSEPSLPEPTPDPNWVKPFYQELKSLKNLVGAALAVLVLSLFFK